MRLAIFCGSVFGTADDVVRRALPHFRHAGIEVFYRSPVGLDELLACAPDALLAVTSTTGSGELPDNVLPLYLAIRDGLPAAWRGLPGGIITLGDSSYGDTFCGAGEQVRELFAELGVREIQAMLRLDASETVTQDTDAEPWVAMFIERLKRCDIGL